MRSSWRDFTVPNKECYQPFRIHPYADGSDGDRTLYLTVPKDRKDVPLVIFFHGGGMTGGERECPTQIYNGEYAVAEPRYRLSPAAKAPAQIEDAARAVAWCFEHAEGYGIDRNRIFVGGMSAGAFLAALVGMIPEGLYLLTSIAMAASALKLSRSKVLVQDMSCMEALARVDVLCVDKTGTITQPEMQVENLIPLSGSQPEYLEAALGALYGGREPDNATARAIGAARGRKVQVKSLQEYYTNGADGRSPEDAV